MPRTSVFFVAACLVAGCASSPETASTTTSGAATTTSTSTSVAPTVAASSTSVASASASAAPSASASALPDKDHFEIVATLVDKGKPVPACGILMAWGTFTYEAGPAPDQPGSRASMTVLVPCPDMPRKMFSGDAGDVERFTVGDRHKLRVHRITADERKKMAASGPEPIFVADRIDRAS